MLITRIMPKMIISPVEISTSPAAARSTSMATTSAKVMPGSASELDLIVLVLVGVLHQIAYRLGVGRRLLRIGLEDHERAVLEIGEIDVAGDVMGLGIDRHLPGREIVEGEPGLQRLDDFHAVDRARLLDGGRPHHRALIG